MHLNLTKTLALPLSLDEVTPEWLSRALSDRFPGIKISSVEREGERSGTSSSAQFNLTYAQKPEGAPSSVYIKGGFDEIMRKRVWAALIQEARFYAELAPEVPVPGPAVYFAGIDEEAKQGVLIMEDMRLRGIRFGHITQDVSVDTVAEIITAQARLHAHFWKDPRLEAYRAWAEPARAFVRYLYREKHWDHVNQRSYASMIPHVLPDREFALAATERLWKINAQGPQTLLHGDCHVGNLYFHPDGSPGFMDWQCTFAGTPGHDHAEMINCALDTQSRRENERDLLKLYRSVLVECGVSDAPGEEEIFLSYRQNQMHLMGFSVMNPYDMQTVEVTDTAAVRALEAAIDLDMIGALGLR